MTSPPLVRFGIPHLDSMLYADEHRKRGLRGGLPFALIGEPGTSKTLIGEAFLCQALRDAADPRDKESQENAGVAIFVSSRVSRREDVIGSLAGHLAYQTAKDEALKSSAGMKKWRDKIFNKINGESFQARIVLETLAVHDFPSARLMHRVERLVAEANATVRKLGFRNQSHRIRFVIDDIMALRAAFPEVATDPLFLPILARTLKEEGVSSLLVASQPGRPDHQPTDSFDAEMRFLFDGYLVTWRIPFLGESKTAITFVSGFTRDRHSPIREVVPGAAQGALDDPPVKVSRDLEMYTGIERGAAESVPLEIRLYMETDAAKRYILEENKLFNQLFFPDRQSDVISAVGADEYDSLRDYCYLSASTRLPKTLIVQIDEFWHPAQGETMLTNLHDYLTTDLNEEDEDHFEVFKMVSEGKQTEKPTSINEYPKDHLSRKDFFPLFRGFKKPEDSSRAPIDRIPFTWDFGFLLLAHDGWYSSTHLPLPLLAKLNAASRDNADAFTVGAVLDALVKPSDMADGTALAAHDAIDKMNQVDEDGRLLRGPGSWRAFFESCIEVTRARTVSGTSSLPAFDLTRPAGESFSCLVMEMWFSEILEQYGAAIRAAKHRKNKSLAKRIETNANAFVVDLQSGKLNLQTLILNYSRELYMTWMLLVEVIDFNTLVQPGNGFAFSDTTEYSSASATRHWYKTASDVQAKFPESAPAMPVRMPGYFSTRGDWYLAMAEGSRSHRLGNRALDILSSRRANITRLQQGLGLPVRDIAHPAGIDRFRTKLFYFRTNNRRRATLSYGDLISLGADETIAYFSQFGSDYWRKPSDLKVFNRKLANWPGHVPFRGGARSPSSFFWLWRSQVRHYDRDSRIWQKWLVRLALTFRSIRMHESRTWRSGLEIYDDIARHSASYGNLRGGTLDRKIIHPDGDHLSEDEWMKHYDFPKSFVKLPLSTLRRFHRLVPFLYWELAWHNTGKAPDVAGRK